MSEPEVVWKGAPELQPLLVPIESLILLPGNPRKGDIPKLMESLDRFGQRKPIGANDEQVIITGNHTMQAAQELGWTHIAKVDQSDLEPSEQRAYALADNRLSDLASYDNEALVASLQEAAATARGFTGVGFTLADQKALEQLAEETAPKRGRTGSVVNLPAEPVTQLGDVWHLGPHRLYCVDTLNEDTPNLIGPADMVLTDPPFAIYGSSTGIGSDVADDKMVRPFFAAMFRAIAEVVEEYGHVYVHCDWRSWAAVWEGAKAARLSPKNMVVWDKGGSGLGSNYANTHELVGFWAKLPPRTVMGESRKGQQRSVFHSNIIRANRPTGADRQHNAAKPVDLLEKLIENSTDEGQTVADLFCGSGSTLIACENLNRVGVMVEIDPGWCDVTVDRYRSVNPKARIERNP